MLVALGMDPDLPVRRLRLGLAVNGLTAVLVALVSEAREPLSAGFWFFVLISVVTVVDYRDNVRRAGRPAWEV